MSRDSGIHRSSPLDEVILITGTVARPRTFYAPSDEENGAPDRMGATLRGDACRRFGPRCEPVALPSSAILHRQDLSVGLRRILAYYLDR